MLVCGTESQRENEKGANNLLCIYYSYTSETVELATVSATRPAGMLSSPPSPTVLSPPQPMVQPEVPPPPPPSTPPPHQHVDLVHQLQEELGRKNMLYLKHHLQLSKVIGEGVQMDSFSLLAGFCLEGGGGGGGGEQGGSFPPTGISFPRYYGLLYFLDQLYKNKLLDIRETLVKCNLLIPKYVFCK